MPEMWRRQARYLAMPHGPNGERRPADVNARALLIAKIATGEIDETPRRSKKVNSGKAGRVPQ
jgi:hypothetical protein